MRNWNAQTMKFCNFRIDIESRRSIDQVTKQSTPMMICGSRESEGFVGLRGKTDAMWRSEGRAAENILEFSVVCRVQFIYGLSGGGRDCISLYFADIRNVDGRLCSVP